MTDIHSPGLRLAAAVVTIVCTLAGPCAATVTLVEDGRARCSIVVPREHQTLVDAARDLQYHLRKMSGADVPVVHQAHQASGVGIYIDTAPLGAPTIGRMIDRKVIWPDGYVIEVVEFKDMTAVILSSAVIDGVRHAVYGLLEDHLGCHWFVPGPIGEHIPKRRTVTLDVPGGRQIVKPDFEKRTPWYNGRANRYLTLEEIDQLNRWYRRNRHGEPRGKAGHGWAQMFKSEVLDRYDEDGDGVSDLIPMVDGARTSDFSGSGLCMSHPAAVDIAAEWFIGFFNGRPEFDHWSFSQGDAMTFCACDRCRTSASNQGALMLNMSNRVIERVNQVHPDKRITIMPYEATLEPPAEFIQAHENLNPIIVAKGVSMIRAKPDSPAYRRQVERWMSMLPRAWSYDYVCWSSGPWPLFQSLQRTRDFYVQMDYTGVMDEYLGRNLGTDTHMWLSARMAWDHDLRVEHLLDEFYPAYFGAAAEDMRWVYERIERHMLSAADVGTSYARLTQLYPPELIDECLDRIKQAKTKIADDPTIVARIERGENCLRATRRWLTFWSVLGEANRSGDRARRAAAAGACKDYLDLVDSLDGTLTLGGGGMRRYAQSVVEGLTSPGTFFNQGQRGGAWPGNFFYYDRLDQGGKIMDARSRSGFHIGAHGLYLEPGVRGEIIYHMRTTEDLRFKDVHLPGRRSGWDLAINLALPQGGHNGVEVSVDDGRTWIVAYKDIDTSVPVLRRDLTQHVGGTNQFLIKLWVQNSTEREILALDSWVLQGITEKVE